MSKQSQANKTGVNRNQRPSNSNNMMAGMRASQRGMGRAKRATVPGGVERLLQEHNGLLSDCASEYAASLANPFTGPENACIPDTPALLTSRRRVWSKGTFTTSTVPAALGNGFIAMAPLRGAANDITFCYTSTTAWATPGIGGVGAGSQLVSSNSEFVSADFGLTANLAQVRVVSAGVRIRYIGSELIRGGQIIGLHHPAHVNLNGFTVSILDSYKESERFPVERGVWTSLVYRPVDTDDLDFVSAIPVDYYMGFCVVSADPLVAYSYEFECFVNLEFQGNRVTGRQPSHADPVGFAAVQAVAVMSDALQKPTQQDSEQLARATAMAASEYVGNRQSGAHAPAARERQKKKKSKPWWEDLLGVVPGAISAIASLF